MIQPNTLQLVTGTTEVLIAASNARLITLIPQATTTGTVTVREAPAIGSGTAPRFTAAIGLSPQGGAYFGDNGVAFAGGLTIQLSQAADVVGIVWGPRL